jgi:AcrR family transcriptional regulator
VLRYGLEDLTVPARIRQATLRLMAERGAGRATLRAVAAEAGVSIGAISHHFPSKRALEESVDQFVRDQVVAAVTSGTPAANSVDEMRRRRENYYKLMGDHPEIAQYIRRQLLDGGEASAVWLRRSWELAKAQMAELRAAGHVRALPDPDMAVLINQLLGSLPLLFGDVITAATGVDLSTSEGLRRWQAAELDLLEHGLFSNGLADEPKSNGPSKGAKQLPRQRRTRAASGSGR